ncbi:hypothetical protein ISCGN_005554 [Ixodes scapularis]
MTRFPAASPARSGISGGSTPRTAFIPAEPFRQRETIGFPCSFERLVSPWPCRCVAPPSVAVRAVPRDGDSCPWGGNRLTGAPGVRGGFGAPTGQSQAGGGTEGDPTKDKAEPVSNAVLAMQPAAVGSTNSIAVCPQLQSRRRMPLPVTSYNRLLYFYPEEAVLESRCTYRDGPQYNRSAETLSTSWNQGFRTSAEVTNVNGSSSSQFSKIKRTGCSGDRNLRANESGCWTSYSQKPKGAPPITPGSRR